MRDGVPGTGLVIYESPKTDVNWESFEDRGTIRGKSLLLSGLFKVLMMQFF
jgi:hypothetical protein